MEKMDKLSKLLWGVTLRRATLLQTWLEEHILHYPGASLVPQHDPFITSAACSCGAHFEAHVVIGFDVQVTK